MKGKNAIAVHGGAGMILREKITPLQEKEYKEALTHALQAGYEMLKKGGTSLQAVEKAVVLLEDCPFFNAGKGAVFNNEGRHELDAAIMDGNTLEAGAVCGVRNIKNPVSLAKAVLNSSRVMLAGKGAENFARENNLIFENDEYFFVQQRFEQWQEAFAKDITHLDHIEKKHGTVGAVALDMEGNLAAATSTGGLTNKKYGRIGDSPIIGAGTYANNRTCAISCTGEGEFFIRTVTAYDVSCLMEYKGLSLKEATDLVIMDKLVNLKGEGGLIALSSRGEIVQQFNTEGMFRGFIDTDGRLFTGMFRD